MHSGRDTSAVLCRYFKQGCCLRGSSCHFSHDLRSENICRYYLQGTCAYGDRCRYDHVRPLPTQQPNNDIMVIASSSNRPSTSSSLSPPSVSFTSPVPAPAISPWISSSSGCNKTTSSQSPPSSSSNLLEAPAATTTITNPEDAPLCPWGVRNGSCNVPNCPYLHGDMCDVCQLMILHPYNEQLRREHKTLCEQQFEEDLHYSFAVEASKDKVCGICLEVVLEKEVPSERKFGILDCCDHVFCLKCIMSWRQTGPEMSREAIKSCPECRRIARFIMKSDYWCDTPDAKKVLVDKWMMNAKKKPCKFWKSEGYCRFGDNCFFSHEGTPGQRRRRLQNDRGIFVDDSHHLDFVSLLLEATRRHGNVNPSSLLFSLSDDDSDDFSLEAAEDYISSFANTDRAGHVFLPEDDDIEEEESETVTSGDDPEWTTDDDEPDHWIPGVFTGQNDANGNNTANNNSNSNNNSNTGNATGTSLFDQPD